VHSAGGTKEAWDGNPFIKEVAQDQLCSPYLGLNVKSSMERMVTMTSFRPQRLFALLTALLVLTALVTLGVVQAQAQGRGSAPAAAPVKTVSAHLLVNSKGRTLYTFAADAKNKSNCSGQCAKFWPPLLTKSTTAPKKISGIKGTFGVITRSDGTRQLTYDGAPLYTFLEDKKAGQMNGQGLVAAGGYWWAVVSGGK
jgi:predicted lipoprotein with Yx(FWY)xxD motif